MVDLFDLFAALIDVFVAHALEHDHGESAFVELIQEYVLPLYRFHGIRQIQKHIVVHSGFQKPDRGRNQKDQSDRQYDDSFFYNSSSELQHVSPPAGMHTTSRCDIICALPPNYDNKTLKAFVLTIKLECAKFVHSN